jgi:3-methyladenine DNA glycosylase AlkC
MPEAEPTALKEWFNVARFRGIADLVAEVHPQFNRRRFLKLATNELDSLSLIQRVSRATDALRATLPDDFPEALRVVKAIAPKFGHNFVAIVAPDFVAKHGAEHVDLSLEALRFLTEYGSAEFAIRVFLKSDLEGTLATMKRWASDPNEHVRRLACEGCRPRLPWSFRLEALVKDPALAWPLLERLKCDPSLYVRKSVGNHLNDIAKDHPTWLLDRLETWDLSDARTAWIVRRGLRTLVKAGNTRALALLGTTGPAQIKLLSFTVSPATLRLGQVLTLSLRLNSTGPKRQRVVIDYAVHYRKNGGRTSRKVFKWKEVDLDPKAQLSLVKTQRFRDFTTRKHQAGRHTVEVVANGITLTRKTFVLVAP